MLNIEIDIVGRLEDVEALNLEVLVKKDSVIMA